MVSSGLIFFIFGLLLLLQKRSKQIRPRFCHCGSNLIIVSVVITALGLLDGLGFQFPLLLQLSKLSCRHI
ncbi:hypothetical protein V8C44DRAFT_331413 [Trichoderma aethiopicum]